MAVHGVAEVDVLNELAPLFSYITRVSLPIRVRRIQRLQRGWTALTCTVKLRWQIEWDAGLSVCQRLDAHLLYAQERCPAEYTIISSQL